MTNADSENTFDIELVKVHKSFGPQKVLDAVDLPVARGKTTVIVGGSGQGKSVIMKHMLGLVEPDEGEVRVFGRDISRVRKKELQEIRMHFGVLFQNVALFDSMTCYENVAMPLRERLSQYTRTQGEIFYHGPGDVRPGRHAHLGIA